MLTAMYSGLQVLASEMTKKDGPFSCPECDAHVLLKKGVIRVPHFAHIPPVVCSYGVGESELHRSAKVSIFQALEKNSRVSKLQLERSLGEVRPDISFCLDGKFYVAVEVQVSKLSPVEIVRRTAHYSKKKVSVLWMPPIKSRMTDEEVYRPSGWELLLHKMYFGRTYYWSEKDYAIPVQFVKRREYVPPRYWYNEYAEEDSAGGYWKSYKSDHILKIHEPISVAEMQARSRDEFLTEVIRIPDCLLWLGPRLPSAPKYLSAKTGQDSF